MRARSLLAVSAVLIGPLVSGTTDAATVLRGCAGPNPVRAYTAQTMAYEMRLDLTECDWHGSTIRMSAKLDHLEGVKPSTAQVFSVCGVSAAVAPAGTDAHASDQASSGRSICTVRVTIDHAANEISRYRGEIRYPGPVGEDAVRFDAICSAGGSPVCHDVVPLKIAG